MCRAFVGGENKKGQVAKAEMVVTIGRGGLDLIIEDRLQCGDTLPLVEGLGAVHH
jgi:hypothetical protein